MELPLYSPEPKSGWIPTDPPMKLISALEFASTGAAEMFSFHALFAGNGKKSFRLAACPKLMPLQALVCVLPSTTKLILDELLVPGFGLLTVTPYIPEIVWLPEAVSCVGVTNVVLRGEPARNTCAPFTKLLPVIVSVQVPALTVEGVMALRMGTALSSVIVALALALASAKLTAV